MKGSLDADFKAQLKALIVHEADKDIDPASVPDDGPLFGPESVLGLDSIDALQISMALQLQYGWDITDPKKARRLFASINSLADYLRPA